ncbi:hypothetical protein CROQUDRAFT_682700 [Cronartium quercuum f. sp. fusiforme G11]|uniref:CCHC-type domain-containing protein n=1 Tax=Cronartium quercuum f. sp. fusiforme G11 TaxID=708437 RepID=A0A9P6NTL9_9BASI|nr:hypothetical protein CROQUDRAFT_682700 [Cronartium quercuum f. sp. fusiforme G11]
MNADSDVWHLVAYQLLEGPALNEIEAVVGTRDEPETWLDFVSLMSRRFPSTLSKASVMADLQQFGFRGGKRAVDAFGRFRTILNDAKSVKLAHEPAETWISKLPPALRSHVQTEVDRALNAGEELSFEQIVLCSISQDNRRVFNKESLSATSEGCRPSGQTRLRKRKSDDEEEDHRTCYNCGKRGHIFGNLDRPTCPEPATDRTLNYFKRTKGDRRRVSKAEGPESSKE